MTRRYLTVFAFAALAAAPLAAQEPPFLSRSEYLLLANAISGDAAYEHVRFTTQFHKPRGGAEGLMAIARYVEARAREYGLDEVRLIRQDADAGAWNARAADLSLEVTGPEAGPAEWRRLASLRQTQLHLADNSRSADVTAEIVDVGDGTDSASYAGKDIRGKLVLAWGNLGQVAQRAVRERGAVGVISRPDPSGAQAMDHPDQVRWSSAPGWTFAFVLSHRQGAALAQELARGPRRARAVVDVATDSTDRWQVMVEGVVRGTDPALPAIVLTAHMQEEKYSANDDGSGVATTLEVARAFATLVANGRLPRPRRSIRFWWTTEISSERQYFADHPEEAARLWLNINHDMVGANQGQDVLRVQNITRLPWTRAHFLEEVADATIRWLVDANGQQLAALQVPAGAVPWRAQPIIAHLGTRHRYNAALVPFHNNTDHMTFTEAPVGVPGITFTNWPDNYIHTTDDDLWNIDRTQLERNAVAMAMMTAFLARAGDGDVPALVAATVGHGMRRLGGAYGQAAEWLLTADSAGRSDAYRRGRAQIEEVARVAARHVQSAGDVATGDTARRLIAHSAAQVDSDARVYLADLDELWRDLMGRAPPPAAPGAAEQRLAALRPVLAAGPREFLTRRNVPGVPGLHNLMAFEVLNAVDGRRNGRDIFRLVAAEARAAGAAYYGMVTPEAVETYLGNLVHAELVRMQP